MPLKRINTVRAGLPAATGCTLDVSRADLRRTIAVIPVYGRHDLTHQVLQDIRRERVQSLIVDNGGDYQPRGGEWVIRPGKNLGWVRGNNVGLQTAFATGRYDRCVLLNNDVRLSRGFFDGLIAAEQATGASIIAASYDGHWQTQRPDRLPEAIGYQPRAEHLPAGACDGTAVSVHRRVCERAGLLDARHFGRFGWWAMTDWCIRAKQAGLTVAITRAAYCNHLGQETGRAVHGSSYQGRAHAEAVAGRAAKYGNEWAVLADALSLVPIVVCTAITGGRDWLKTPSFQSPRVRWVCYYDRQSEAAGCLEGASGWDLRRCEDEPRFRPEEDPRRYYKPLKCCPHWFFSDCQRSIWIDASFHFRDPIGQLAWFLGTADLACFDRNADRRVDCVYEEGRRCVVTQLDHWYVIADQLRRYRDEGHPEHFGLAWSGCMVRNHTPDMAAFGEMWLDEIRRGSKRDQVSMMVCLRRLGVPWRWIPGSIRDNPWLLQELDRPQRPGLHDAPSPGWARKQLKGLSRFTHRRGVRVLKGPGVVYAR